MRENGVGHGLCSMRGGVLVGYLKERDLMEDLDILEHNIDMDHADR